MRIFTAPKILIIQLKRFKHGENILSHNKIQDFIDFPIENLDLTKYVAITEDPSQLLQNIGEEMEEEAVDTTKQPKINEIKVNP